MSSSSLTQQNTPTPYQLDQRIGEHHLVFHDPVLVTGKHGVYAKADAPKRMFPP
jgi:hypothetical protein